MPRPLGGGASTWAGLPRAPSIAPTSCAVAGAAPKPLASPQSSTALEVQLAQLNHARALLSAMPARSVLLLELLLLLGEARAPGGGRGAGQLPDNHLA